MADGERVSLPLLRGVTDGADCGSCPLSSLGMPNRPVCGEGPEDPKWIIIGEGPGAFEVNRNKPFCGPSGQVVNQILGKIGADRSTIWVTNATLCVEGTTQVRLGDGSLERIDRLVASRYTGEVQTIDHDGSITTRRVTGWHRNMRGTREMRNVSFRWAQRAGARGRTHAVLTEDHPVLTPDGWRNAAEITGGLIATGDRAPSEIAQQIAWGTLLGDGTFARGSLVVRHARDQREYVEAKARALAGFGVSPIFAPATGLQVQDQFGFRTQAGAWGHATHDLFYPDGKKRIPRSVIENATDLLFAIWYLDDGSMQHRGSRRPNAEICGAGFPEEDLRLAGAALAARGFENVVRNGRIRFNVEAAARFSQRIARFVPPALDYKLRPEDRGQYDPSTYATTAARPFFDQAESVCTSPRRKGEGATVYCLDVEDTHNFITPGAVVHNCQPPSGADVQTRERAAEACRGRLINELSWFPGKPILTFGAVAARAVIPKATLDMIEPPETIKALKKAQKLRQQPSLKAARTRRKAITKAAEKRLKFLIKQHRKNLTTIYKVRHKQRPPEHVLREEVLRVQAKLERKANEDAIKLVDLRAKERALKALLKAKQPKKPKKPKQVKITDICGTLFDVDVDGSGERPVVPAIHPAALLRGGGASIGGSHTPDMAFVNLMYDAGKVQSLANGIDIRLRPNLEFALYDQQHVGELFLKIYHSALEEGACSIDLETYVDDPERHHALMAYVAKIKVIGIATSELSVSLSWELFPAWAQTLLQVLLSRVSCTFHNGLYDRTVLRAYGFVMCTENFEDTLLGHHASFPGNSHRLQIVTSQFYGVGPWKSEYRNQEETLEGLAKYNALDTAATHALRRPLFKHIARTKTERVYNLDKYMSDCASHMHLAGMPVDRDINSQLLATFSKNVAEARRHVEDIARDPKRREMIWHYLAIAQAGKARKLDPPDFEARYQLRLSAMQLDPDWKWKINAGKHIAALLQAMGVELIATTEGGDISTKKDVLESLVGYPIVRDILAFRENDKLLSTFCLAPETRVLTGDLRWVELGTIRVGDELIGFDEHGRGKASKQGPTATYQPALVEGTMRLKLDCYRVTTDRGVSVVASDDHLWLARDGSAKGRTRYWKKTCDLQPGDLIATFVDPWDEDTSWEAGFIAGFLDGEGCVLKHGACFTQNPGTALSHMLALLKTKGFDTFVNKKANARSVNVYPHGGVPGAMRMIGQFRAPRLIEKARKLWNGKKTGGPCSPAAIVRSVEFVGQREVVAMKTSTKTFIAEGMLTHNCWPIFDRRDPRTGEIQTYGFADEQSRIRPIWNIHRITGRWASQWPVVSNVPKDKWKKLTPEELLTLGILPDAKRFQVGGIWFRVNKDNSISKMVRPNLRAQIRARPGRKLVGFDFAQIEARVIALISGTPFLMEVFADPTRDIHIECAQMIWEHFDSLDPDTRKQLRENVKNIEYGYFYMAQLATLHQTMLKAGNLIKIEDLAKAIAKLAKRLPEITEWQQSTIRGASQPPYEIKDFILGRRRTWPMGNIEAPEAVNYGVQTAAASIMNTGMANMMPRLAEFCEADPIAQIHDAAVFECWEDEAERLASVCVEAFEQVYERDGRSVPFKIETKIGQSWDQV
jgi:DNA polymerase I-like protein with 3'-5' exonuclease and polymerase domains/uracil-DNA glycosylase